MFRPQEISATDARKYFSQIISKVQYSSKSFVVKSYRKPVVRIVKEDYIAILEQVLGKKTVGQILEISGNDNLFDATKIIEIKKVFQRRLSGPPQSKPQPRPQPPIQKKQDVTDRYAGSSHSSSTKVAADSKSASGVAARHASPPVSKPQQTKPQSPGQKPRPKDDRLLAEKPKPPQPQQVSERGSDGKEHRSEDPQKPTKPQKSGRVLLLSNGKNYA